MLPDQQQLLQTAIAAAKAAGKYLLAQSGTVAEQHVSRKNFNDFVTGVDQQSEKLIVGHLTAHFPDIAVVAEEGNNQSGNSGLTWVIDPLDGTTNFIQNIPVFSISIALMKEGKSILGLVFDPNRNEMFTAIRGHGAFLNDQRLSVSSRTDFQDAILATSLPHRRRLWLPAQVMALNELFMLSSDIRRLGSAALDLCYTACGRFDGYWELGLSPWDLAAGALIVEEAGGKVSDFWGGSDYFKSGCIIASAPQFYHKMTDTISRYFAKEQG